jgi:ADP-ribosylglycohydrolase
MPDFSIKGKILGGLWGAVVGDALGVPVEFQSRERLRQDPVQDMRAYGTYDQPAGTWSDDSSMMLCTVECLLDGFDTGHLGSLFVRWLNEAHWTPWGNVFDVGGTTRQAINRLKQGVEPEQAGLTDELSNGNGSLMRILPVALRYFDSPIEELLDHAHRASALTHRHIRCQIACGLYCAVVSEMIRGTKIKEAYLWAINSTKALYEQPPYSEELPAFARVFSGDICALPESGIKSSGYVIHSLEASLWCLCNTESYADAVLRAVNLGEDTDTTAIVTGGLAGIEYGVDAIPSKWVDELARRTDLEVLFDQFVAKVLRNAC